MRARSQGFCTGAEGRVLVGRAHGELVAIELAQRHGAGLGQLAHHRGVEGRAVALQHLRAGGAGEILGDEDVLVRDRHAQQRRRLAGGDARVGRAGLRQRHVLVGRQVGAQCLVRAGRGPGNAAPLRRPRPPSACSLRGQLATRQVVQAPLIRSPSAPGTGRARPPARCAGWPRAGSARWPRRRAGASATSCDGGHRVRQRLHAGGVHRAHLLDDVEEAVDLGRACARSRRAAVPAAPGWRCGRCLGRSGTWWKSLRDNEM